MVESILELTEIERVAKDYLMKIILEASAKPCDIGHGEDIQAKLPAWYDDAKFKRGQQFFHNNRMGILTSNMCGLLTLLAEPRGLKMLSSTGRSSTPETARKRYVSTILHVVRWYEIDLAPGSSSWDSLNRVRRMHLRASVSASSKSNGMITQEEVALTTLGFMGFAITRPHLLGIDHDCREDQEAFVHFWAVMGHMLGVHDEYNMCLLPLDSVIVVCQAIIRYVFIPFIQLESPDFREMVEALLNGLSPFLPHLQYEVQMFCVKRLLGVPGYQYDVDMEKETVCRQLFTRAEVIDIYQAMIRNTGYDYPEVSYISCIPLFEISRDSAGTDWTSETHCTNWPKFKAWLKLDSPSQLKIAYADPDSADGWRSYLNDSAFYKLSSRDQSVVRTRIRIARALEYRILRYIIDKAVSIGMYMMRKWYSSKPAASTMTSG